MKIHLLMLGLLFLILSVVYGRPIIQNDGISYYALTASLLKDGDFNLQNQFQQHREVRVIPKPDGSVASYYSCGIAFLYFPFLFVMDLFSAIREWMPYAQNVRFPFSHSLGFFIGSIFFAFASVALAHRFLVRYQKLGPASSSLLALSCFAGTPLIFYAFTVPSFAHASDTFLFTVAFLLAISPNSWQIGFVRFRNLLLGFVLAFSILLRNNNIVIVPVLVLAVLYLEKEKSWKNAFRTCVEIFLGALPVLLFHIFYNFGQYGKLVATGYTVEVKQHVQQRAFRFFWIFFHPVPGIYPWSPIAFLGTIGLILAAFKKRREAIVGVAVAAIVIVSIRFAAVIFPGATFGQRLLTHLYILWVFGLSELYILYKKPIAALSIACVLWTFLLFNTYYILTGSRESKIMTKEGGASPLEWIQTAESAYRQAKGKRETTNRIGFWYKNLGAKPYPTLLRVIF